MTALTKYQKLECQGLWRDSPDAQRREVVVNFGDASLTLADPRTDTALTHWSLPAVERLNPGVLPALYAPGAEAPETLEIDDPDMIAALEKVHVAIVHARAKPGRLRGLLMFGGTALVISLLVLVGPDRLARHTAAVVPDAARTRIGQQVMADLAPLTGRPCADAAGQAVLDRLAVRLFGEMPWQLRVVRDGVPGAAHLPGRILLLDRGLISGQDRPDALAGFALAEAMRAEVLRASFGLLTRGALPDGAAAGYGEALLKRTPRPLDDLAILARFDTAGVPSSAYAFAIDPSGETTLGLIEADPHRTGPPVPLMSELEWTALQAICAE
jgi:hypothetical protein